MLDCLTATLNLKMFYHVCINTYVPALHSTARSYTRRSVLPSLATSAIVIRLDSRHVKSKEKIAQYLLRDKIKS